MEQTYIKEVVHMVDLNKAEQQVSSSSSRPGYTFSTVLGLISLAISIAAIVIAAIAIATLGWQESNDMERGLQEAIAPNSGPEQQPVQDNGNLDRFDSPVMPSDKNIEAPTSEYPFGGYEGYALAIVVPQDGNVWSEFDRLLVNDLPDSAHEELVLNLKNKLEQQEGRTLDLVLPGNKFILDLTMEPSRYGTPIPPSEVAPDATVEPPQGGGPNPEFDPGVGHTVSPQLGASDPEDSAVSDEIIPSPPACNPNTHKPCAPVR